MKDSVLLTLAGSRRLHAEEICKKTGLNIADLKNCVSELNDAGANIREYDGYLQWLGPFECLHRAEIEMAVGREDCTVEVLDSTTSTNAVLAAEASVHKRVILAEHQSAGVGRRGKRWLSPLGKNLYMSCGWSMPSTRLFSALSLAVGISIVRALRDFGCAELGLKWPNDLYIKGRKVGGLLIDSSTSGKVAHLVVGLGINVHEQEFPADLAVPATTLAEAYPSMSAKLNRNHVAALVLAAIFKELSVISRGETIALASWLDFDVSYNKQVKVMSGGEVIKGLAKGITADGEFILEIDNEIQTFSQAQVSLRI